MFAKQEAGETLQGSQFTQKPGGLKFLNASINAIGECIHEKKGVSRRWANNASINPYIINASAWDNCFLLPTQQSGRLAESIVIN